MDSSPSRAASIAARRQEALARLTDIEQELFALRRTREGLSDDDEHDPDGVPLSAQWSRLEGLRQNTLETLAAIDDAHARWSRGEDGRCSACGRPIAPARLVARPEATTCIDCAP
ncbi:TraR/DksA family transcriptional regulator [Brachybacterium sp. AOP42-C2-15]|uniref:TraR/DksA family transcriptional regulator n=1 Tax=unclassified Brachybacterium TaxID=2623841 RepID=UPI003F929539